MGQASPGSPSPGRSPHSGRTQRPGRRPPGPRRPARVDALVVEAGSPSARSPTANRAHTARASPPHEATEPLA
eukprot:13709223-Alexandrium_andersonii.AAC.1